MINKEFLKSHKGKELIRILKTIYVSDVTTSTGFLDREIKRFMKKPEAYMNYFELTSCFKTYDHFLTGLIEILIENSSFLKAILLARYLENSSCFFSLVFEYFDYWYISNETPLIINLLKNTDFICLNHECVNANYSSFFVYYFQNTKLRKNLKESCKDYQDHNWEIDYVLGSFWFDTQSKLDNKNVAHSINRTTPFVNVFDIKQRLNLMLDQSTMINANNFYYISRVSIAFLSYETLIHGFFDSPIVEIVKYNQILNNIRVFFRENFRYQKPVTTQEIELLLENHFRINFIESCSTSRIIIGIIFRFFSDSKYNDFIEYLTGHNLIKVDFSYVHDLVEKIINFIGAGDNSSQLFFKIIGVMRFLSFDCSDDNITILARGKPLWWIEYNSNFKWHNIFTPNSICSTSKNDPFTIENFIIIIEELYSKELAKSIFDAQFQYDTSLLDFLYDKEVNFLVEYLYDIIKDYRSDEITYSINRIYKWIQQFDIEDHKNLIIRIIIILKTNYFSKNRVTGSFSLFKQYLAEFFDDNIESVFISYFDRQIFGSSQKEMLSLISEKDLIFSVDDRFQRFPNALLPNTITYIYIDDAMYSGNRARKEIENEIRVRNLSDCRIISFHLASYAYSKNYVETSLRPICKERNISLILLESIMIEHRIFPLRKDYNDECAWYEEFLEEERSIYNPNWSIKKLAQKGYAQENTMIKGVDFEVVHSLFLEKGLSIIKGSKYYKQLRPLGYSMFYNYGFGNLFVSYRNISNNSPLALWFPVKKEKEWTPLFPRKLNKSELWYYDAMEDYEIE
jgi:hypothetical protein